MGRVGTAEEIACRMAIYLAGDECYIYNWKQLFQLMVE
jgi:hypothetical protein